jgi:hypothetical protein
MVRRAEPKKPIEEKGEGLSRLNSRIRLIEKENDMAYDVVLKTVPSRPQYSRLWKGERR